MSFAWSDEFRTYMLNKYRDNHWWELSDLAQLAWWQLREPRLAVPFHTFHKGTEKLLGRPVWTHEFVDLEQLLKEAPHDPS